MSLVENLISQISANGLSGITRPDSFDLNDDTFAKLLEKQLNSVNNTQPANTIGEMGAPAGFMIEPLEGTEFAQTVQDQMEILGDSKSITEAIPSEPFEMKDLDLGDYFSNLLKTNSEQNANFMNFAKKHASNAYNVFSRTFVADMQDFAEDIAAAI